MAFDAVSIDTYHVCLLLMRAFVDTPPTYQANLQLFTAYEGVHSIWID